MKSTLRNLFFLMCMISVLSNQAQIDSEPTLEKLSFGDVFKDVFDSTKSDKLSYKNIEFTIGRDYWSWVRFNFPQAEFDSLNRIIIDKTIRFYNCKFISAGLKKFSFLGGIEFYNCSGFIDIKESYLEEYSFFFPGEVESSISLENNHIVDLSILAISNSENSAINFYLKENSVEGYVFLSLRGLKNILISENHFIDKFDSVMVDSIQFNYNGRITKEPNNSADLNFSFENTSEVILRNNTFDKYKELQITRTQCSDLEILDNIIPSLQINNSTISERLTVKRNEISSSFGITKTVLPEFLLHINWEQLKDLDLNVLGLSSDEFSNELYPYFGKNDIELAKEDPYLELLDLHARLYRTYKDQANLVAANGVYVKLQDLITGKNRFIFKNEGGLKNWFRWRLNQLLSFYVGYGTDPAKALLISFYIIIIFSVFYFFFPSEWDVTSKQLLLAQMKSAINKNEPGTAKAVLQSFGFLLLSFVNAFTLSLNSFVTLGFGTIPTTGLARYVCIIQGFIGWFLLSLFSVALINQVIF